MAELLSSPRRLFVTLATAEAVTWALLLVGMFLKYVTETTELGVRVFGMVHGVVFLAYCLTTVLAWVDARWSFGRGALALLAAIPPFATLLVERSVVRRSLLGDTWRLRTEAPASVWERIAAWILRHPARGVVVGLVALVGLTGVALVVGPPGS